MNYDGVDFWMGNHHTFELTDDTHTSGELLGKITSEVRVGEAFDIKVIEVVKPSTFEMLRPNGVVDLTVRVHHNKIVSYSVQIKASPITYEIDYDTGYLIISFRCVKIECDD